MVSRGFTAIYKKTGNWFSAWIEEVPGVNTQGRTKSEARENLKDALLLVLKANRAIAGRRTRGFSREQLSIPVFA